MTTGTSGHLPVAEPAGVRRAAVRLVRADGRAFAAVLVLNALAAGAGLAGPWLLGRIVDGVGAGGGVRAVDRLALGILLCSLAQLLLARWARYVGHRFGERTLARVREEFVDRTLALPASVVERAGTGDLTARGTADVAAVGTTLRDVGPDLLIHTLEALFLLGAVFVLAPLLGAFGVLGLTGIWCALRWYLRRARDGYLAEGAATSEVAEILAATASGARTVEAFGLQERRIGASREALETSRRTRLYTLYLRTVFFPVVEVSYIVPVAGVLLIGGALHARGVMSLGAVVAAALYLRQLGEPLDQILMRVEQLQSSGASFARVEGLARAPRSGPADSAAPADDRIDVTGVRYAYERGGEVLRGVDLTVRPGERLAVVGPSGAGKTTLSRLLAGVDAPSAGTVTVGGVPVVGLEPERLRRQVVLVTQEHHVFLGTVRDNLLIAEPSATDDALWAALAAVGADGWVRELPDGLGTVLGSGGCATDGSQAQQLALARVVLADPHTLILDEATALLDPTTARHTERALAAVLEGRTVIAIAHRLHTAHDADRVAVMEDGRLTELGTHEALVAAGGAYAALWHSWHGDEPSPS
ncbi:multidrug ABC transporter ATP-binding protein [Streptomyces avermitilis]|uniref:ABC transporter ATP-binding protein n=2 Tax=Streptomyces avermitilis TaxID=33903 RepID=Q82JG2_STRAW|nr:ABC transporter ATP-binding protein [Streptomyces avermitilis]MYS98392.1 ATP-binding cassette domain-containing protein [Streptomyces sp. SID5469]KUN51313.1 multidrug ABC transporter ATP-binding protein [Streptomyces avermitilis]OOV33208.1 multidrug ABC transporter ATP-binding protein [Streptomyces avermitilis]BAC70504.1 putative ABC transporter ATP-binding protein [Streptomyces avermitilis MA-4680 = NBRC 14893]BBJ50609.1 multidrug ABC transporter ATP-binding protein [Streptomyces avermitil